MPACEAGGHLGRSGRRGGKGKEASAPARPAPPDVIAARRRHFLAAAPMASQDVLSQTTRLASSSALLQVRGGTGLLLFLLLLLRGAWREPPEPQSARRCFLSLPGAVPGGHVWAERLHPAPPLSGAPRRRQREVSGREVSPGRAPASLPGASGFPARLGSFFIYYRVLKVLGGVAGPRGL